MINMLMEYEQAKSLLEKYGIKSIESKYIEDIEELKDFIKKTNGKVALKAISQNALHKSKAGLVELNVTIDDAEKRYNELLKKAKKYAPFKILAQKMAEPGIEIIIGGREDQQFGKLILLGLGGVFVEAFRDFSLRVCPITKYDAEQMINELKSKNVITYNGKAENMIIKLLLNVSKMLEENEIKELDLNPIIVRENGYDAVDLRIIE
jgi:succinyl-CoA synthetase beta subunit